MNIGDRIKFKTIGGWYNCGIIRDMDEKSYLVEVDKTECDLQKSWQIPLPYYARVLSSCEVKPESEE